MGGASFFSFFLCFFDFFFFERTRPAASMRPSCLIYLSTSNTIVRPSRTCTQMLLVSVELTDGLLILARSYDILSWHTAVVYERHEYVVPVRCLSTWRGYCLYRVRTAAYQYPEVHQYAGRKVSCFWRKITNFQTLGQSDQMQSRATSCTSHATHPEQLTQRFQVAPRETAHPVHLETL